MPLFAQLNANFVATPTSGCSPLLVSFTDLSTGPVSAWQWDFGNGAVSNQQNPGIIYNAPGTYTVSLTVSGGGNSATETKIAYISVFGSPTAAISANVQQGCAPLDVQFTDQSTHGGTPITSWIWDFGDGNTSTLANPQHTYTGAGNFSVSLFVTDGNGCDASISEPNYLQVAEVPQAGFVVDSPLACTAPHLVNFNNTSLGTGPLTYTWDFGDGNFSNQANPQHSYQVPGVFDVELIVTGPLGCADTLRQDSAVQIAGPSAAFVVNKTRICLGEAAAFQSTSTGNPNRFNWDFGDGSQDSVANPLHAYNAVGIYSVRLTVESAGGCRDSILQNGLIEVVANPVADFSANILLSCQVPTSVNFTDLSSNAISWSWDFGDGGTSTLAAPSHTYTAPGLYDVRLAVMNADSCVDTLIRPAYVQIIPPTAYFTSPSSPQGCFPLTYDFIDSSYTPLGTINSWSWDFGDGNTSNLQSPSHTYTTAGFFNVTLIVATNGGCRDTLSLPNFISTGTLPTADFVGAPDTSCYGDTTFFTNLSVNSTSWTWDFGDSIQSGSQNPSHVYPLPGCYDVQLIASNAGCTDTLFRPNYICIQGARAAFSYSPAFACAAPVNATFNSIPTGTNLKWSWDFGDGFTANGPNVNHTYVSVGSFPVTMYVEDTLSACSDSVTIPLEVGSLKAFFAIDSTYGCIPHTVNFSDSSSQAVSWRWDFGDGTTDTTQNPTHTYTTTGIFPVQLIVRNIFGCEDTLVINPGVAALGVSPDFGVVPPQACVGDTLQFNDASVAITSLVSWQWDFGDGTTAGGSNPTHAYAAGGNYPVTLIAVDSTGCTDTLVRPAAVQIFEPMAAFTPNFPVLCPGDSLLPTNLSSGNNLSYAWDFGDGNGATGASPGHVYTASGTYPIQLTITDNIGCQDSTIQNILIEQAVADFAISDSVANCPPLLVAFTNQSTGTNLSHQWNFGDGTGGSQVNPNHLYTTIGTFSASLIVTTPSGCTDSYTYPTPIDVAGTIGGLSLSQDTVCPGVPITLAVAGVGNSSFSWIFGDGNVQVGGTSVQHAYGSSGSYLASVIIQDSSGCSLVIPATDSVYVQPGPVAAFAAGQTQLCAAQAVPFTDMSTYSSPLQAWWWDFGNGATSTQANPVASFSTPGTYDIALGVTDSLGCSDTLVLSRHIRLFDLQAGLQTDTSAGCMPLMVNFSDNSVSDTNLVAWNWDFGNGNSGTGNGINTVFPDTGTFDIQLVVTNAVGCMDTVLYPGLITAYLPNNVVAPEVLTATVLNNVAVEVSWSPLLFRGAGAVRVERSLDGQTWQQQGSTGSGSTQFVDNAVLVDSQSYAYRLIQEDSCGGTSPMSRVVQTMLLAVNDQDGTARLAWNPFADWAGGVAQYEIEARDANGGAWQNIATLPGSQLQYQDLDVQQANGGRCYRVRAVEANGNLAQSLSNEACGRGEIWVPNTLTPNNDGSNDQLIIPALSAVPGSGLSIFNRWGSLVFSSDDYANDWAGQHMTTGEALPDGTYFYVLTLGQTGQELKGYITLIR